MPEESEAHTDPPLFHRPDLPALFEFLMSERELEDKYKLSAYPRFELGERAGENALAGEYIDRARTFFDEIQTLDAWKCENGIPNPGWYSGLPDYLEYQDHIAR